MWDHDYLNLISLSPTCFYLQMNLTLKKNLNLIQKAGKNYSPQIYF